MKTIENLTHQDAAYIAAMIFSVTDGKYTAEKGKKLIYFCHDHANDVNMDALNAIMLELPKEGIPMFYHMLIMVIKSAPQEFQMEFIYLLSEMFAGSTEEAGIFKATCNSLELADLKILIEETPVI